MVINTSTQGVDAISHPVADTRTARYVMIIAALIATGLGVYPGKRSNSCTVSLDAAMMIAMVVRVCSAYKCSTV
jgi:Ni,Fe-hydrogenase I cytochrome b subunit